MQNENQNIRRGVVTHFVRERNFGFIKSRDALTGKVETYFMHISNIDFCEPEYPSESDVVEFVPSSILPRPGKFPLADHVNVYKKPEIGTAVSVLAGANPAQKDDKAGV